MFSHVGQHILTCRTQYPTGGSLYSHVGQPTLQVGLLCSHVIEGQPPPQPPLLPQAAGAAIQGL